MAEVTGPISSLPGSRHASPDGSMCDDHPDRPAVARVQGETDSFGSEMYDLCQECLDAFRAETVTAHCDWCKGEAIVRPTRDTDEGLSGPIYYVCTPCYDKQQAVIRAEFDDYDYYDDYDEPDDYDCDHANYDADILTGEAWCWRCQHKWIMTHEEITREIEHQAEYMAEFECDEATNG
ncbi:hypothetical protein [Rhizobium hidalgonense]|uniref:hypothetical protein n=1 Tax=Rhizobium hidalgonense TaxID=1538159 RepID=UPI002870B9B1|nr:hypothetical protein [Rhizobium hidalgonense]MDR9813061.1 hypothetical protein [Rhizobium hidalgonense]